MKSITLETFSRRWLAAGIFAAAAMAAQAQTAVTFQIDMSTESSTPATVYISGSFNGWPAPGAGNTNTLINVGGTIWSNTFSISDAPGTVESCKFQDDTTGWEPISNNRQFVVGTGTQVLPLTTWNNNNYPAPTNLVAFSVDLSAQVVFGSFTNGQGVTVSGDFEGWDNGLAMTNNPAAPDITSNIYSGTFPVVGFPPTTVNYKFRASGGWESPASTGGNNRQSTVNSASQVLPLVYYNDNSVYDLVLSNTVVTFTLHMTNGTPDNGGAPFDNTVDTIYINGDFVGWWSWNTIPGGTGPAYCQMTNNPPGSDTYQQSFTIPRGNPVYVNYKYSQDGFDDENGFGTNHVREIRSYPPTYVFPMDNWSFSYAPGANTTTNIVEKDFGNLAVKPLSNNVLPVTWLGRPGVVLQSKSSLSGGVPWSDLTATDGTQSTNWQNSGSAQFFRLKKK